MTGIFKFKDLRKNNCIERQIKLYVSETVSNLGGKLGISYQKIFKKMILVMISKK